MKQVEGVYPPPLARFSPASAGGPPVLAPACASYLTVSETVARRQKFLVLHEQVTHLGAGPAQP